MSATTPQKGIELLDWMDARSISATIQGEHPQVIAAVLSHLDAGLAAAVLQLMPEDMQADMMYRVATLDSIQPDALAELERVMQKKIKANAALRSSTIRGARAPARTRTEKTTRRD